MKLVLVARDASQLLKYREVAKVIESLMPKATVVLLCGERDPKKWDSGERVISIFSRFKAFLRDHGNTSVAQLTQRLAASALPITLYQSDPRYVYGEHSDRELVLEQLYIEDFVRKVFQEQRPDFVFAGAAGHLFWTVSGLVAEQMSIPSYRILGLSYLNPGSRGVRYWFTRNLEARLSSDPQDSMDWPADEVEKFVEQLLEAIRIESYRLDHWARTVRRSAFLSQGWNAVTLDLRRWLRGGDRRARWRLRALWNDVRNRRLATPVDELQTPFIVFPLNMPVDEQLTLRAPHVRDLFSSIEQIANVLPYGHTLVVKEHPVFPGMLDSARLKRLLMRRQNVKFVPNSTNIHALLEKAALMISINSTAAVDALVRGVPVVTLGEVFYKGTGLTYDVDYMYQLSNTIKQALRDPRAAQRQQALAGVMCQLFQESYPGAEVLEETAPDDRFQILARGIVHKVQSYTGQHEAA